MSEASLSRIYDAFAAKVDDACASGHGEELLYSFMEKLAVELADNVFLKIDVEAARITSEEQASIVWQWLESFPEQQGLRLLDGIATSIRQFNGTTKQIEKAQLRSARAYRDRLDQLLSSCSAAGSA